MRAGGATTTVSWLLRMLVCPECRADLRAEGEPPVRLVCEGCPARYEVRDGVPIMVASRW